MVFRQQLIPFKGATLNSDKWSFSKGRMMMDTMDGLLEQLPPSARDWAEGLPWSQRRYILSLCHLMCAAPPEMQAEFLDNYTADGLVSRMLQDRDTQQRFQDYLKRFRIQTELSESLLRAYIRQFYIHSSQDARRKPNDYLESALRLVMSTEECNNVLNYILGFEVIKMIFKMSWLQHEKLALLQSKSEEFIYTYIKPIQYAHRVNSIIVPKDETVFFARRDYFIKQPEIKDSKLTEIVMATFITDILTHFGFSITRHPQFFQFDYEYIFYPEESDIFP